MPLPEAPYPSGKGAVCKTAMQRFEPARRLQSSPFGELCPKPVEGQTSSLPTDKPLRCIVLRLTRSSYCILSCEFYCEEIGVDLYCFGMPTDFCTQRDNPSFDQ